MAGTFGESNLLRTNTAETYGMGCVLKNIEGIVGLCDMLKTSYGINGMYKLVVDSHKKTTISRSASSILAGCDVEHPTLRMLIEPIAHLAQMGDCTGFLIGVIGEILREAAGLIERGIMSTEIAASLRDIYPEIAQIVSSVAETVCFSLTDKDTLRKSISGIVKEERISMLLGEAISEISKNGSFPIDSVRVTKIEVGSLSDSERLKGMLLEISPQGTVEYGANLKTAIYTCPLAMSNLETKGTVLFKSADDLLNYAEKDEQMAKKFVDELTANGVGLIVCSGSVDPLLLDYLNEKKVIVISLHSKFDLRRMCMLFGGRFSHMLSPMPEEALGTCSLFEVCYYGERRYVKVTGPGRIETILVKGSLPARLEEIERVIGRAIYALQICAAESMRTEKLRLLPGAGKCEVSIAERIQKHFSESTEINQLISKVVGRAIEKVGRRCGEQMEEKEVYDIAGIKEKALEYALVLSADILSITQMFITKNEDMLSAPKRQGHWDDRD